MAEVKECFFEKVYGASEEVLKGFEDVDLKLFLDGTLGAGGHANKILEAHSEIEKYIGIDQDMDAIEIAKTNLKKWETVEFFHGNFKDFENFLEKDCLNGVLLDIGVSSMQL